MGKKKHFIEKSKAVTFRLTPAVDQAAPIIGDPELVNIVDVTDHELEEREKYGIYYADNYNYMSHLKAKDDPVQFQLINKTLLPAPEVAKLASNILEIKGKEIKLDLPPTSSTLPIIDGADEIDPEILEMLNEEEAAGFGSEDDLEDDFLDLAGGVDLPEGRRIYEEFRKNTHMSDSDIEDDESVPEPADEHEDKSKLRSILKNPGPQTSYRSEMDARFEAFYQQMNESENEETLTEDEDAGEEELMHTTLINFADAYKEEKDQYLYSRPDELSKELSLRAYEKQESEPARGIKEIEVEARSKKMKWDCESVASTYTNIYNHPTVICEVSRRRVPLTKANLESLNVDSVEEETMDCDTESVRTNRSIISTVRLRGETTEERRQRKKAVKEERRERRIEKKTLKGMFKEEKKKKNAQRSHVYVAGRPIS